MTLRDPFLSLDRNKSLSVSYAVQVTDSFLSSVMTTDAKLFYFLFVQIPDISSNHCELSSRRNYGVLQQHRWSTTCFTSQSHLQISYHI